MAILAHSNWIAPVENVDEYDFETIVGKLDVL